MGADLLGGCICIQGAALRVDESSGDEAGLCSAARPESIPGQITAVPYALRANRGVGEMTVWIGSQA